MNLEDIDLELIDTYDLKKLVQQYTDLLVATRPELFDLYYYKVAVIAAKGLVCHALIDEMQQRRENGTASKGWIPGKDNLQTLQEWYHEADREVQAADDAKPADEGLFLHDVNVEAEYPEAEIVLSCVCGAKVKLEGREISLRIINAWNISHRVK